jgi:hypothetical protein
VGLERDPLNLVSTIEELLERKSRVFCLETYIAAVGIRRADHLTPLYPQNLALTLPTNGGRSVGIVRSRTIIIIIIMLSAQESAFCFLPPFLYISLGKRSHMIQA